MKHPLSILACAGLLTLGLQAQPTINTNPETVPTPASSAAQFVSVTVGRSKGPDGYYYARGFPDSTLLYTVYSPKVALAEGRRLDRVAWTEANTWRCTVDDNYVWVYLER